MIRPIVRSLLVAMMLVAPINCSIQAQEAKSGELSQSWRVPLDVEEFDQFLILRHELRWDVAKLPATQGERLKAFMVKVREEPKTLVRDVQEPNATFSAYDYREQVPAKGNWPARQCTASALYTGKEKLPTSLTVTATTFVPRTVPGTEVRTISNDFGMLEVTFDVNTLKLTSAAWGQESLLPIASASSRSTHVFLSGTLTSSSSNVLHQTKRIWASNQRYPVTFAEVQNVYADWPKEATDHGLTFGTNKDADDPFALESIRFTYVVKQANLVPEATWGLIAGEKEVLIPLKTSAQLGAVADGTKDLLSVRLPVQFNLRWEKPMEDE